ncbi:TauD/TfdA family dioxygenase [Francisella sp. SYW-9]|uniref:TauD/TfdA family dioxygenase n=1 Tax=Francisella sp. SYW-9 TaxID=2610888 RepID=UPI00123E3D32|nr:TauD/TfdA family dioxygenase [Francisella sp. SYW-9]
MVFKNEHIQEQRTTNGKPFPYVLKNDGQVTSSEEFLGWIKENKDSLKDLLLNHDAVLFRNFPVGEPQTFEEMLDIAEFPRMGYVGGAAPRNKMTSGRVLTANESPSSESIPFHHEMAQTPNPPKNIFFYCHIAAEKGGATPIVQSNLLYKSFIEIDPEYAKMIENKGVRYVRVMPPETDAKSAIGRSWKETFQCETKEEAEKVMKELGTEWEWLENDNLKTITAVLPAVRFDEQTQQKTFFNSMIAVYTGWNDARNSGEKSVVTGDGEYLDSKVMQRLVEAAEKDAVAFKWHKGDVLWINNNTVLHSRQPYEGERKICASISQ